MVIVVSNPILETHPCVWSCVQTRPIRQGLMREGKTPVATEAAVDASEGVDSDGSDGEDSGGGGASHGHGQGHSKGVSDRHKQAQGQPVAAAAAAAAGGSADEKCAVSGALPTHLRV